MQGYKVNSMLFSKSSGTLTTALIDVDPRNQDLDDPEVMLDPEQIELMVSQLPLAYQRPHLKVCMNTVIFFRLNFKALLLRDYW